MAQLRVGRELIPLTHYYLPPDGRAAPVRLVGIRGKGDGKKMVRRHGLVVLQITSAASTTVVSCEVVVVIVMKQPEK